MPIVNNYEPQPTPVRSPPNLGTPDEPYDVNFCFPEGVVELENDLIKLVPFVVGLPAMHASLYLEGTRVAPDLFTFQGYGPFPTMPSLLTMLEYSIRANPSSFIYAILDKTRSAIRAGESLQASRENFAGTIGYGNASPQNASIEVGHMTILPSFQRTHVASNAVGLCVAHALERSPHGMGLRRVQWQAHGLNTASVRLAERLGFQKEGLVRWARVWPEGKMGRAGSALTFEEARESVFEIPENGDAWGAKPSADSWMLSVCWDDWEKRGAREKVQEAMVLRSRPNRAQFAVGTRW